MRLWPFLCTLRSTPTDSRSLEPRRDENRRERIPRGSQRTISPDGAARALRERTRHFLFFLSTSRTHTPHGELVIAPCQRLAPRRPSPGALRANSTPSSCSSRASTPSRTAQPGSPLRAPSWLWQRPTRAGVVCRCPTSLQIDPAGPSRRLPSPTIRLCSKYGSSSGGGAGPDPRVPVPNCSQHRSGIL